MRKFVFGCLLIVSTSVFAVKPLVYFGDTLEWNTEWQRKTCGALDVKKTIIEVSGIACSRVTPGYIWMQSDETAKYIVAADEKGDSCYMKVKFDKTYRWDWEDLSGGVYDGRNYLFIGAFGDNDHTDGEYAIVYLEEPEITPATSITITPSRIKYKYPDGQKHNAEALMYDNREQMIYIITKVYYDVCQVFSIPFRLDYGDEEQTLTYVCDLGLKSDIGVNAAGVRCMGFHLVTAADISPDGKYILIKNHNNISGYAVYSWVLLFTREEGESVAETLRRQTHPEPLRCYNWEDQGEAICWLDTTTFYTTSDVGSGSTPIYKYIKKAQGVETVKEDMSGARAKVLIGNTMYIRSKEGMYTLDGRKVK